MRWLLVSAVAVVLIFSAPIQHTMAATDFSGILTDLERQYQLPSGCLGKIAKVESSGDPNRKAPDSTASGLFQWLVGSWQSASHALYPKNGPLHPNKRFDPVEASKVTAFSLRTALNKNGGLFTQAKIDTCLGLYMSHFLGIGGAAHFLRAYIQDPQQNACTIFAKECGLKTNSATLNRSLADVLRLYAQRLNVNSQIALAGNFEDRNGIPLSRSSGNLSLTDFLPRNTPISVDPERTYPTNYYSGPGTSYNPTSATNQPVSQTLLGQDNTASTAGNPAALIIAQPSAVMRGNPVIVSWTSVRTSTTKPCQVSLEVGDTRTLVAEGNEGTKILATKKEDTAGTWKLTLQCTSLLGAQIPAQSVSVSIQ